MQKLLAGTILSVKICQARLMHKALFLKIFRIFKNSKIKSLHFSNSKRNIDHRLTTLDNLKNFDLRMFSDSASNQHRESLPPNHDASLEQPTGQGSQPQFDSSETLARNQATQSHPGDNPSLQQPQLDAGIDNASLQQLQSQNKATQSVSSNQFPLLSPDCVPQSNTFEMMMMNQMIQNIQSNTKFISVLAGLMLNNDNANATPSAKRQRPTSPNTLVPAVDMEQTISDLNKEIVNQNDKYLKLKDYTIKQESYMDDLEDENEKLKSTLQEKNRKMKHLQSRLNLSDEAIVGGESFGK